jgi:hypothetical protein
MRKFWLMLAALTVAALASVGFAWLVARALKALLETWT